jgi:hypothetical protein
MLLLVSQNFFRCNFCNDKKARVFTIAKLFQSQLHFSTHTPNIRLGLVFAREQYNETFCSICLNAYIYIHATKVHQKSITKPQMLG